MSNIIEFQLQLKDLMSEHMAQAATRAKKSMASVEKSVVRVDKKGSSSFSRLGRAINSAREKSMTLKNSVTQLEAKLRQVNEVRFGTVLKSEFRSANREAKKLDRNISRLKRGVSGRGFMGRIGGWRSSLSSQMPGGQFLSNPLTMAAGVLAGAGSAVHKAMEFGFNKNKLNALIPKGQEAGVDAGVKNLAYNTLLGPKAYKNATQMMRYGVSAKNVVKDLKALGDVSQGDQVQLQRMSYIFAEMSNTGQVTKKTIRELSRDGFNPLIMMSKTTGKTIEQLNQMVRKGKIHFNDVEKALMGATSKGGKFHDMLKKMAKTPMGKFILMKNQFELIAIKIGDVLMPVATKLMDWMIKFVHLMQNTFGSALKYVVIGVVALAAALIALAAAQWVLNLAMWANPISWVIIGIIALIGIVMYLQNKYTGLGKVWSDTTKFMKYTFLAFKDNIVGAWDFMVNGIMIGVDNILIAWYKMKNAMHHSLYSTVQIELAQMDIVKRKKGNENNGKKAIKNTLLSAYYGGKIIDDFHNIHKRKKSKSVAETMADLQKKLGIDSGALDGDGSDVASGITSGGPRSITVNVNKEMIGKLSINSMNVKEGVGEMESLIEESLRRILHSAAAAA